MVDYEETISLLITLADGTSFIASPDGAGNYIIGEEIEEDIFNEINLSSVQIADENGNVMNYLDNQVLRVYYPINDNGITKTFVSFTDMTEFEKMQSDYNAKIDYIACMTGVDLDE